MKKKTSVDRKNAIDYRAMMESHYRTKYFNLFMSSYKWNGFTREEREFIMRQLWRRGNISAFRINDDVLAFAPYAPQNFNMYNSPTEVNVINIRGLRYIPSKPLKTGVMRLNEARQVEEPEVVIGWAQHSMTPISETIAPLIEQIVDLEMAMRTNRFAQKLPILFGITPENSNKMEALISDILNDEIDIGIEIGDIDSIRSLEANPPFILDKLRNAIDSIENRILSLLGIDNSGNQKREREGVDEVNANNELINDYQESVLENLKEWVEMVNDAFGTDYSVEASFKPVSSFHDEDEESGEKGENEDDDEN